MAKRPRVAALIAQAISAWAQIEAQEAILLGVLLDAKHTEAAMAAFEAVHSGASQRAMILAAAKAKLNDSDFELVSALLRAIRAQETERNHLAHGLWNVCDEIPDGALWLDQKHLAPFGVVEFNKMLNSQPIDGQFSQLNRNVYFYKESDIEAHLRDFLDTFRCIVRVLLYLSHDPNLALPPRAEQYETLCNLSRIAPELAHLRAQASNQKKAPRPQN